MRIIRAVRFVAKLSALGFKLEKQTVKPLSSMVKLLEDVPPSRLFDETLKLLQTGHALASIDQLNKLGLARGIYPILDLVVERAADPMVHAALEDTDRRVSEEKPVVPSFLLSCLLWSDVLKRWNELCKNLPTFPALQEAIDAVFNARIGDVSGRGKLAGDMREIWSMQTRFDKQTGRAPLSLVDQPRFRAAFDFLRLRGQVGEVPNELVTWWEEFSLAYPDEREQMLEDKRVDIQNAQRSKKSPPRGVGRASVVQNNQNEIANTRQGSPGANGAVPSDPDSVGEPTKPRRRRRRRNPGSADSKSPGSPQVSGDI